MEAFGQEFCDFVNYSVSPYHAVSKLQQHLDEQSFTRISEKQCWDAIGTKSALIQKGGKYYFTRNGSTIVAFTIGGQFDPLQSLKSRFVIIGAHTDSPCFKIKPISKCEKSNYVQIAVECYGGGLWYSWFDRDLTICGRVLTKDGKFHLVHIKRPLLKIPSLAIHLNREAADNFNFNKEQNTVPVLATKVKAALEEKTIVVTPDSVGEGTTGSNSTIKDRHAPLLLHLLAKELAIAIDDILDFELLLCDTQPATLGGAFDEFIFSPRLDNLGSTFASFKAFTDPAHLSTLATSSEVHMVAYFDHEEVGSDSAHGAGSPLLSDSLQRILGVLTATQKCPSDLYQAVLHNSLLISADMAHAVHPNYAFKHEERHRPEMHKGLVIKTNQNQRYATTGYSGYLVRHLSKLASKRCGKLIPVQEFVVANDVGCGSTIGPILASNCGIRTVDVGGPMLSMHSIREMCGVDDMTNAKEIYLQAFMSWEESFEVIDDDVQV